MRKSQAYLQRQLLSEREIETRNTSQSGNVNVGTLAHLSNSSSSVSIMERERSNLSDSGEYDRPEKLSTKHVKVFKKRRKPQVKFAYDDSDSLEMYPMTNIYSASRGTHTKTSKQTFSSGSGKDSSSSTSSQMNESSSLASMSNASSKPSRDPTRRADKISGHTLGSGIAFIYMVKPPDGGWGWVILIVSFLTQIIVDGIILTIGILLPLMRDDMMVVDAQIVLVAAVQIGIYFLSGSIAGALINSYGFRPVALAGAIVASVAFILASFTRSLLFLILCYSVAGGVGLSMLWTSSQLVVAYYFELYRPLANGFTCSGAGLGLVIFSIIDNKLVKMMDWRSILRVYVLFLILVFLMDVTYIEVTPVPVGILHRKHYTGDTSSDEYYGAVHNYLRDQSTYVSKMSIFSRYSAAADKQSRMERVKKKRWFHKCLPCIKPPQIVPHISSESTDSDDNGDENDFVVRPDPLQRQDIYYTGPVDYTSDQDTKWQNDVELFGTDKNVASTAYGMAHIHDYEKLDGKKSKEKGGEKKKKRKILPKKIARGLALLFDFSLLKVFEFRFLIASAFLFPIGFNIPFVYTKARTTIPPEYSIFISPCIGISNFVVRIGCGYLAYKYKWMANSTYGIGMVIGGVFVLISAFYGNDVIWFQYTYGLMYGVAPGVYSTLRAILYVRYLGLSKLTNAFGLTGLAMGIGVFIGTMIAGILNDMTGSYTASFTFSGICIIMSGGVVLILPQILRHRKRLGAAATAKAHLNLRRNVNGK